MRTVLRLGATICLFWCAFFWCLGAWSLPARAEAAIPRDVSGHLTVMEIKEKSARVRHGKRVRFKVTSQITLENTSEKTILPPIRSVVNIIGAGCTDKVWTRAFSKVEACEIFQAQQTEKVEPGQRVSFTVEFVKPLNVDISYEILTHGVVETEGHAN